MQAGPPPYLSFIRAHPQPLSGGYSRDGPSLDQQLVRLLQHWWGILQLPILFVLMVFSETDVIIWEDVCPFSPHFASILNSPASPGPSENHQKYAR